MAVGGTTQFSVLPDGSAVFNGPVNLASSNLEIQSGAVTATKSFHVVDTENQESSDNLDTINGGTAGDMLILRAQSDGRTVVVRDGTGNIRCAGDFSLTSTRDTITLLFTGFFWAEISRSDND